MAYVITSKCMRAGLCETICPTASIHAVEDNEEWPHFYINPETCVDCGACEAECPNDAIFFEDDLPEEYEDAADINAAFYENGPGKNPL